jgi:hypothetical protein
MFIFIVLLVCVALVVYLSPDPSRYEYNTGRTDCRTPGKLGFPRNETELKVLIKTRHLVAEVLQHLRTQKHSQNAKQILDWMSSDDVHLFLDAGGRMKRYPGKRKACMFINPTTRDNHDEGRLQSKICHELAHLTSTKHDRKWRDTYKYLLNLTSRDLGWTNKLECGSCLKYGICDRKMCRRCNWSEGDHTKCKPLNRRGTLLNF